MPPATETEATQRPASDEGSFTLKQRVALWFISTIGYLAIRLIGATLKFEASVEEPTDLDPAKYPPAAIIAPFWHRAVFAATYFFRNRGISVMTSRSFDGEYIARIIEAFGFRAVRGSSSRGAVRALLGMHTVIEKDGVAAFTIDGPRGPRYVAKPGPVLLARNTGAPIMAFYVAIEKAWILNSWDAFMIPRPFSRAHIRWSAPIHVPREADTEQMKVLHDDMQQALERVQRYAEEQVAASR